MTPQQALQRSQTASVSVASGQVHYRFAGDAHDVTHVLLHGIGSSSASWAYQLAAAHALSTVRVLAWDAPGYGQSTPLRVPKPTAMDYAHRLWEWLDAFHVQGAITLVGHSLGALMAASAALLKPSMIKCLVLLSPARGYGDMSEDERHRIRQSRLDNLQRLGPRGVADARAAVMLTQDARADWLDAVRETMAQVNPAGYTQAVHMLVGGGLIQDMHLIRCPVLVASGADDTITPPEACDAVAQAAGVTRVDLGPVGHACSLQAADAVNALLGLPTLNP